MFVFVSKDIDLLTKMLWFFFSQKLCLSVVYFYSIIVDN